KSSRLPRWRYGGRWFYHQPVTFQFALCSSSLCFSSLSSMSLVWSLCWCLWSYLLLEIDLRFSCSFAQLEHRRDYYP
ncbi:unnamed protein product, partial [Brassica oleracea]